MVMEKAMHRYVSSHKQAILSLNQIAVSIISSLKRLSIYFLEPEKLDNFSGVTISQSPPPALGTVKSESFHPFTQDSWRPFE